MVSWTLRNVAGSFMTFVRSLRFAWEKRRESEEVYNREVYQPALWDRRCQGRYMEAVERAEIYPSCQAWVKIPPKWAPYFPWDEAKVAERWPGWKFEVVQTTGLRGRKMFYLVCVSNPDRELQTQQA